MEKLLIVDDNDEMRQLLRLTFTNGKYLLFEARDGASALETADRERPDIILLDVMMPGGIDGFEVCRRVKANPLLGNTSVILLTALEQQVDKEAGLSIGADYYMTKPFRPHDLLLVVQGLRKGIDW